MPQTSDELRKKFEDDADACAVLENAGWFYHRGWWAYPTHEPTDREWDAIQYLVEEWDHGLEKEGT